MFGKFFDISDSNKGKEELPFLKFFDLNKLPRYINTLRLLTG